MDPAWLADAPLWAFLLHYGIRELAAAIRAKNGDSLEARLARLETQISALSRRGLKDEDDARTNQ